VLAALRAPFLVSVTWKKGALRPRAAKSRFAAPSARLMAYRENPRKIPVWVKIFIFVIVSTRVYTNEIKSESTVHATPKNWKYKDDLSCTILKLPFFGPAAKHNF
jgi:hypothetical protein